MIKKIAVSLFAMTMVWNSVANSAPTVLKIATVAPDGTTWMKVLREGADEIAAKTNHEVTIKFYPGGVMGNDKTVLRKIRIGQLHGGAITGGELAQIYNNAQIYTLPFQFKSIEEVSHVRASMDVVLQKGLEDNGFVNLGMGDGGFAYFFSKTPIRSMTELKGLRVWTPQDDLLGKTVFETAGITPVPLPISDVYTALQTGLLDVVVINPTGAIAFQWYTKLKYMTDVPVVFLMGNFVLDKKVFEKLSPAHQIVLKSVMKEKFKQLDVLNNKDNNEARLALQKNGIEFISLSAEGMKDWQTIAAEAIKTLGENGAYTLDFLKKLQGSLSAYRKQ